MNSADHSDDKDLELMFAEARRYPLLTPEQEREIDGRKWSAVRGLHQLFVDAHSPQSLFPFLTLQVVQAVTTFSHEVIPPLDFGIR